MNIIEFKFFHRHVHSAQTVERIHNHPCYEVVYYVSGTGKGSIEQSDYSYQPGTLILIPPGKKHSEVHDTQTEVVFFACEMQEPDVQVSQGVYFDRDGTIYNCFLGIEQEIKTMKPFFREAICLKIEQVFLEIRRTVNMNREWNLLEECMEYAKNYIQSHIQQNINFQELARMVGYSYDYFRHQFVEHFGMSPKEFVLQERILRVKKRLINTEDSVNKIAMRYSFNSSSHLSRTFKNIVGCTPSEYRERERETVNKIVVDYNHDDT